MRKKSASESFDAARAFAHLRELAVRIGPRLAGSSGEHAAAAYIERVLRSFRLKTRRQPFACLTYANQASTFGVWTGRGWKSLSCAPVMPCLSTPAAGIEAELLILESGAPHNFTPALKGRIVLVHGGVKTDDRPRLLSFKPRALLTIEENWRPKPRLAAIALDNLRKFGDLPMASIRCEDGLELAVRGWTRGRLTIRNTHRQSRSFNIIGEKPGSAFPDEIVVVCGHYDSHMGTRGASDNAAGVAIMLELARVLSAAPTRRTLRFVAFGAEETGLNGSSHYADSLAKRAERQKRRRGFRSGVDKTECEQHRLSFNIDVHGSGLGRNSVWYTGAQDLGASIRLLASETGTAARVIEEPLSSDGTCLAAVGIPALQMARPGGIDACHHSDMDQIRHCSPSALGLVGRFVEAYLRRHVTEAAAFPFAREIPEDQMKKVRDYFTRSKRRMPGEKKARG